MNSRGQVVIDFLRWADANDKHVALCRTDENDRPFANDRELLHEWGDALPHWAPNDLNPVFCQVEDAIDAHPRLRRYYNENEDHTKILGEPEISATRLGWTISIHVRLEGSRKVRPSKISGQGDTPQEAAAQLIAGLDYWAEAIK
jgi:hypothetical protein